MIRLAAWLSIFAFFSNFALFAEPCGKWTNLNYLPTFSVQEHYDLGNQQLEAKRYQEALNHFLILSTYYPESPFYSEALYLSGVCCFHLKEYDIADKYFSRYLLCDTNLNHFDEIFNYKFEIAELFGHGKRKHLFGLKEMPKWGLASDNAIALYDEIIASLPSRELAAQSFFGKAAVHFGRKEYRESVDALQNLIRQFPLHPLAGEAFLFISNIYLHEAQLEAQNPDLIGLAQINLQQFCKSFPTDERIEAVESNLKEMQELFAKSLYNTGRFYERKKKPHASIIYYKDTIKKFPESNAAKKSEERLALLDPTYTHSTSIAGTFALPKSNS